MKATIQIPDEMYREVKAKSALEGRSVRSITVMLYTSWLRGLAFSRTDGIRVAESIRTILESPNLAKANPGFVDRMIVGEYATAGNDTYSCEKSFRRLDGAVVIS